MFELNNISEDVKDVIKDVITKYNLDPNSKVIYGVGAENGAGLMTNTLAADIVSDEKTLHLFLKCGLNVESTFLNLDRLYTTERHFFSVIYPDFFKFAESKGIKGALDNVPKCFATSEKDIIVLENLKKKGYEMINAQKAINADHISSTFKSMARFHAVSFAFKDQNKERYEEITGNLAYFLEEPEEFLKNMSLPLYNKFLKELDPIKDKLILHHSENIPVKLLEYFKGMITAKTENSILTKGDCWSNNLMYRYENGNKESPIDVVLVDWQTAHVESAAKDLSMFFFTSAAKGDLKKYKYFLKVYHDELAAHMKKLDSDSEKIFPFSALEEEWKQHSRFGYGMAMLFIYGMIAPKPDKFDVEEMHNNHEDNKVAFEEAKLFPEYISRMKDLSKFCIENFFI